MINLEERISRIETLLKSMQKNIATSLRVSLPAKVTGFDPEKQTISCIPTVREYININGKTSFITLPELKDVPIQMPRGGNWILTFPIQIGDECMVIFQDLCIDGWWFRGDIQNWNDLRRHDLSDAIAIFSPWSQPNKVPNYNTKDVELRSLDGSQKVVLSEDGGKLIFPKGYTVEGNGTFNGNLQVNGSIVSTDNITTSADVIAKTVSLSTHTHLYHPGSGDNTPTGIPQA